MKLRGTLALSIALAASGAGASGQEVNAATRRVTGVTDLPAPFYRPLGPAPKPWLMRTHDLFRQFAEGEGTLGRAAEAEPLPAEGDIGLHSLPWHVPDGRADRTKLLTWAPTASTNDARRNEESMLVMVLLDGESWCSPTLTAETGARLRFEARSIGEERRPRLVVTRRSDDDVNELGSLELSKPESFDADGQTDLSLEGGKGRLCFAVRGGSVAIGEARVLAPEPETEEGEDPRPRWVIFTILDALRGDVLRRPDAGALFPTLSHLAESGHDYRLAQSPGCHTRASVWPLLTGRDLMRIDPLKRRHLQNVVLPRKAVFSRANVFVSYFAQAAGYHSVFLGNNSFLSDVPAFSRYSNWGSIETGTQDTIDRLPELFRRYADERIFLVFYVSTPHGQSSTPRRLYDEQGCGDKPIEENLTCRYTARVRHADEALGFLQRGLEEQGLASESLHIVTSDHGELFGDGMPIEGVMPILDDRAPPPPFVPLDRGHGSTCHWRETHVPLVVHGKGIAPAGWDERVSGLDIVPTFLRVMQLPAVGKLDGTVLPLQRNEPAPVETRGFVAYGYCSSTVTSGDSQFIWWLHGCRFRDPNGTALTHGAEIWEGGRRVATDRSDPEGPHRYMAEHEAWLRERFSGDAFVFAVVNSERSKIRITAKDARIVDFGPSATVFGLDDIDAPELSAGETTLSLQFHDYRGLYYVATLPPDAPLRIEAELDGDDGATLGFAGPLQIPVERVGEWIDPRADRDLLISQRVPAFRPTDREAIRLWWQPHLDEDASLEVRQLTELDRVLREWGYIR